MPDLKTTSDETLLQRIAAQDRGAFELLFRRHYTRVFQFVHRMLHQRDLVEEVVNDTFFAVWRSAASFAGQSAVTTWLLGIGYRQALKAADRKKRAQRFDGDDDKIDSVVDLHHAADPQASAAAHELQAQLQAGIDELSDAHRVALELTALGNSAAEVAQIVGCPEATVRTRVFHARAQLRKFLGRTDATASNIVAAPRRNR